MKKSIITVALLSAMVGQAVAASSVDLSVTGSITPASCTPALSAGGVVDHGKISVKDLNPVPSYHTVLPLATLGLSVNCTASTLFAIKSTDNRVGSSAEPLGGISSFGLGLVNGDRKVGWYTLRMSNALGDGAARPVIESINGKVWFSTPDDSQIWQPDWMRALNAGSDVSPAPLPVVSLTTDLLVQTIILRKDQLPTGQELPLDGSATLDIVYL